MTKKTTAKLAKPGTVGRWFQDRLLKGATDNAKLVAAARKAFPDRSIGDNYAAWYRRDLKLKGLLRATRA